MDEENMFWKADIEAMEKGYIEVEDKGYKCLICGEVFDKDEVFPMDNRFITSKKMIQEHIRMEHNSVIDYMLGLNKSYTSLTENQKEVLTLMYMGFNDKEIAKKLKVKEATIRNYRFKFKEKEKQAKLFLAIMSNVKKSPHVAGEYEDKLISPHVAATQVDERYNTTEGEQAKVINNYFDETGGLKNFPAKEKRKIIVLREIAKNFKYGETYSEKQINRVLKRIYEDYVLLRRYLIEYGFLDRSNDGSSYWVK